MVAVVDIIIVFGGRAVHDFVAQGPGFDVAAFPDTLGHLIDFIRMGSGTIHDHRGVDLGAVCQGDTLNLSAVTSYIGNFGIEQEFGAFGFGGAHDIVGRQGGIIYITTFRTEEPAFEFFFRVIKKCGVFGASHRPELV